MGKIQAAVLFFFCVCSSVFAAPGGKKVVILHSYQHDYEWTRLQHSGILSELESRPGGGIQIKTEYLDTKRSWNGEREQRAAEYLGSIYRDYAPDLVIVTDNDALTFVDRHGAAVFGDVPVVFSGINDFDEAMLAGRRDRRTGVAEYVDFDRTLAALRHLFPRVKEIRVLADDSTTGIQTRADFIKAIERSNFPLSVSSFSAADFAGVLAEARLLDAAVAVVLLSYARDPARTDRPVAEIVTALTAATAGPVFSCWDFNFGFGIVGGALTSGFAQGREAGRIALRILAGESAASIPVSRLRQPDLTFDWRALKRFGIDAADLPEGSVVRFKPQSLYERDPRTFRIALATVAALLLIIGALAVALATTLRARARLRANQERLSAALEEQRLLLREVHHRVNNNFQVISSLLSLQRSGIQDPAIGSVLLDSENRIKSMALVHERLYDEGSFAAIDFLEYLTLLCQSLLASFPEKSWDIRAEVAAESLFIDLETAIPLALIFNELIVNSIKYAFPEGRKGTIRIGLERVDAGSATLSCGDDGVGLPESIDPTKPTTLGFQLMQVLADQVGAEIAVERGAGTTFTLTVPRRTPPR